MLFAFVCSACRQTGEEFPDVSYPESTSPEATSEPSAAPDDNGDEVVQIIVASPYNDSTIQYLAKLYYCKQNGLMGDNTGSTVALDYLDGIDTDFVITSLLTSNEGASVDNINVWDSAGIAPDVFLTGQLTSMINNSVVEPLNGYDSASSSVGAGKVFLTAASHDVVNGTLYGIPYYSTVMLLAGNSDHIPSSGKLPFKNTTVRFREYLELIKDEFDVVPLSSGYDMVPYINSSFAGDSALSFMVNEEYRKDSDSALNIISNTLKYVNELYDAELTANYDSDGANPVFSRHSGLWTVSSSEIESWSDYYPGELYLVAFPLNDENSSVVPMTTLYSLCVNIHSSHKDFASDFASFMALDSDARMLTERLEPKTGFLPSVKSSDVWNMIISDELFGQAAQFYYQSLDNAVYCPNIDEPVYSSVMDYLASYDGGEFDAGACYGQNR